MRATLWNAVCFCGKREFWTVGLTIMFILSGIFLSDKTGAQYAPTAPVKPSDLAVASDGGNALMLIWEDNSDNEDNFVLERKIGTEGTFSTIATLPAETTKWRDDNTANLYNTPYIYQIKAVNTFGESKFTLEAGAVTELAPTTSCQVVEERGLNRPPAATPPGLPQKLGRFRDDLSGLEVIRLTDESDGDWNFPAYSYWKSFNSNNTRIFIVNGSGGGAFYRLNPDTFRIIGGRVNLPKNANFRVEGMHWSNTNPDIMYAFRGAGPNDPNTLHEYNVQNGVGGGTTEFIRQFSENERRYGWLDQMTVSEDNDNVFAWTLKDACEPSNNNPMTCIRGSYYFVWRRSNPEQVERGLFLANSNEPSQYRYNEVHISKNGNYMLRALNPNPLPSPSPLPSPTPTPVPEKRDLLTWTTPPTSPPTVNEITYLSHFDLGRDFLVGSDNTGNGDPPSRPRIRRVNFNAPGANTLLFTYKDWRQESYLSLLADDEDWVLVSQSQVLPAPGTLPEENMYKEIFLLSTSGTLINGNLPVKRLAHHYSVNWDDNRICTSEITPQDIPRNCYRARVHANISRDGKFVAFTSTWGVFDGRKDVFILRTACPTPTNAIYSVGGRVTTATGAGMWKARVTLEDSKGNTRIRETTMGGYYTFPGVPPGSTAVTVSKKNTEFSNPTQDLYLTANREDINFSVSP